MTDPLDKIRAAVRKQESATAERNAAMQTARDAGAHWQTIADAAQMTPHGVRYALGHKRSK